MPKKAATEILMQCRTRLLAYLKVGESRANADKEVIAYLREQDNILSPYAADVVPQLFISEEEVKMRVKYGDAFADAYIEVLNMMKKNRAL